MSSRARFPIQHRAPVERGPAQSQIKPLIAAEIATRAEAVAVGVQA